MVEGLVPEVPFDRYHAEAQAEEYLGWPTMLEELLAELSTNPADDVLPTGARTLLATELARPAGRASARATLRRKIRTVVPARALRLVPPRVTVPTRLVGFRAYAVSRMATILREDARRGSAAAD